MKTPELKKAEVVDIGGHDEIYTEWREGLGSTTNCFYSMDGKRILMFPGDDIFPAVLPDGVLQECKNGNHYQSN
jgi:hypothetical protein